MPSTPDGNLARVRHRLLRTAYLSTVWEIQRTAWLLDSALAATGATSPEAAETVAAHLAHPPVAPLTPETILERARAAGAPQVEDWPRLAEQLRPYARDADSLDHKQPAEEARRIWSGLRQHRPRTAAQLALLLQGLPDGWLEHLFGVPTADQVTARLSEDGPAPETAPVTANAEDCAACGEANDACRYHQGVADGMDYARELLAMLADDPAAQEALLPGLRRASGSTPPSDAPERPFPSALVRYLGTPGAWADLETHREERDLQQWRDQRAPRAQVEQISTPEAGA